MSFHNNVLSFKCSFSRTAQSYLEMFLITNRYLWKGRRMIWPLNGYSISGIEIKTLNRERWWVSWNIKCKNRGDWYGSVIKWLPVSNPRKSEAVLIECLDLIFILHILMSFLSPIPFCNVQGIKYNKYKASFFWSDWSHVLKTWDTNRQQKL